MMGYRSERWGDWDTHAPEGAPAGRPEQETPWQVPVFVRFPGGIDVALFVSGWPGMGQKEKAMRVRDLMTAAPISVDPGLNVIDARRRMAEHRIRHLVVLEHDRVVGIVTDRDIRLNLPSPATSLSVWEMNYLLARLTVGQVMTRAVVTIDPDRDVGTAAQIMVDQKIGALPVMDGARLVGIVTESDFVRAFASEAPLPGGARRTHSAPVRP